MPRNAGGKTKSFTTPESHNQRPSTQRKRGSGGQKKYQCSVPWQLLLAKPNTTANSKAKHKTNAEECRRQDEEFLPHRKATTKDLQRRGKEGAEGKRSI